MKKIGEKNMYVDPDPENKQGGGGDLTLTETKNDNMQSSIFQKNMQKIWLKINFVCTRIQIPKKETWGRG